MVRLARVVLLGLWLIFMLSAPSLASANAGAADNLSKAEQFVAEAILNAQQGKLPEAKAAYDNFHKSWRDIEDGIKNESGQAYKDIEAKMGKVVYAFAIDKQQEIVKALQELKTVNEKFIHGEYPKGDVAKQEYLSLNDFLSLLKETKENAESHAQQEALLSMEKVTDSWLSVEGTVVAQSAKIYSDTERDMVVVQAMLSANPPDYHGATKLLDQMLTYLSPLAAKTGYTMWDAAMIIIREGLEALLVVTALLAFVNKSARAKGKGWIWVGVATGLLISIVLAVVIKFVFSSGAFGGNNALIAGWTGVIAAVMLLYVSYWLHSNAHISQWQQKIRAQTEMALTTGKLVSLAAISFLAVFREGTETVLFFIGMVNQISVQELLLGLLFGFGLLGAVACLMLFIGVKLPLKPFFLVSSVIVFYLCLKFTGMGIHSLQLAKVLPSSMIGGIPSIDLFALYPSWESTLPQVLLVIIALAVVIWKRTKGNQQKSQTI